jgi:hypothetical protein
LSDRSFVVDITLTTVDDGYVSKSKRDDSSSENVDNVRSLIHEIYLGQDSDRSKTLGIDFTSEFQSIRVSQISVGGSNGEDDGVGLLNELQEHVADLNLNIARLISDSDLGETGKIDEGEGEDVRGEDTKTDWKR